MRETADIIGEVARNGVRAVRGGAMGAMFLPRALRIAAATFADQPRFLGEILVALYAEGRRARLTDTQRFVLAECREEIGERLRRRAAETERKRRQRQRKGGEK